MPAAPLRPISLRATSRQPTPAGQPQGQAPREVAAGGLVRALVQRRVPGNRGADPNGAEQSELSTIRPRPLFAFSHNLSHAQSREVIRSFPLHAVAGAWECRVQSLGEKTLRLRR